MDRRRSRPPVPVTGAIVAATAAWLSSAADARTERTVHFVAAHDDGAIYWTEDLNGDGDALDAGEIVFWGDGIAGPAGMVVDEDVVFVAESGRGIGDNRILRLQDVNCDDDALDTGETLVWAAALGEPQWLARLGDGTIYAADAAADAVWRLRDVNGDGDALDVGEALLFADGVAQATGLILELDGLLVSSGLHGTLHRLRDRNGDGDALDVGETLVLARLPDDAGAMLAAPGDCVLVSSRLDDTVYLACDHNADGDALDVGEVVPYADWVFGRLVEPAGMEALAEGGFLLADELDDEVVIVQDLNGDGDALDVGEVLSWAAPMGGVRDVVAVVVGGPFQDCNGNGIPDQCESRDCNENGIPDDCDIAEGRSDDYNLDGIPDECQELFSGEAVWINPAGGLFRLFDNWDPDTPYVGGSARFPLDATYSVIFDRDVTNELATVNAGSVTFDLGGNTWSLTSTLLPGLTVGEASGDTAGVTVIGGAIDTFTTRIGSQVGSIGSLTVSGSETSLLTTQNLCAGCAGPGLVTVSDGALLISRDADIGALPGSDGSLVRVTGRGSRWDVPLFMAIDRGELVVEDEGTVSVGFGIFLFESGRLSGDGFVFGDVVNFGAVEPGSSAGTLTITGDYEQVGVIPVLGEASGTLVAEIGGTIPGVEHDVLDVTGTAELGGGLLVRLIDGFVPALDDTFGVVNAGTTSRPFDVALLPGLAEADYMRVEYGASPFRAGDVTIRVDNLANGFEFEDPRTANLTGLPTGVVVGDFDDADGPDVAVTIPAPEPGFEGTVLVLLNAGTDGMGNWLGFAGTTQTAVGVDPSALTAGLFDTDAHLDLAVANAGDDDVSILFNDGTGQGTFLPRADVPVGHEPRAIVSADLTEDGTIDLAVANTGADTVLVLSNDGDGAFTDAATIDGGLRPQGLDIGDLDEDKDIDLVIAQTGDGTLGVVFQELGVFDDPLVLEVGNLPRALTTEDLDGNGFVDVVAANELDGTVSVVLNDGQRRFRPSVELPVGAFPRSVTSFDFEEDGDVDVALVADDEIGMSVVQVLRNDRNEGAELIFAAAAELVVGEEPVIVTHGDLDGDAAQDLITVNEGLGSGPSSFAPGTRPGQDEGSANVLLNAFGSVPCPADLDHSGSVDFGDILAILSAWGNTNGTEDLDENGTVDFGDLLVVLGTWGPCP